MQRMRYEIDPYNRIVVAGLGTANDLPKFRRILDGQFRMDENNNLTYHIKTPIKEDDIVPHQIMLRGEWSLTDDHKLRLTLDKWGRETFGDQVTLQGEILDVNENSLLFAITTKAKDKTRSTYVLDLGGSWKADEFNRLSFHVKKEEARSDILTFDGIWEINKNNQIIYQYEKARLIRKKREIHTLTFRGYWDIKNKARLSYVLSKSSDSAFDFETSAGIFKEDYIKYELGIGLAGRAKPVINTVTLCGRWSIKRGAGLIFEIEYENNRTKAIVFGAEVKLTDKDTIVFKLKDDKENKDIGVSLELSHEILGGDGEAFLRVLESRGESAIYAGAAWGW